MRLRNDKSNPEEKVYRSKREVVCVHDSVLKISLSSLRLVAGVARMSSGLTVISPDLHVLSERLVKKKRITELAIFVCVCVAPHTSPPPGGIPNNHNLIESLKNKLYRKNYNIVIDGM